MRALLLVVVAAFPFLFGISFAIALMTVRLPTPPGIMGGRAGAIFAALVRMSVYAGLAFAVGFVLHDALDESVGTASALTAGPFLAGVLAMPAIASRMQRERGSSARGGT